MRTKFGVLGAVLLGLLAAGCGSDPAGSGGSGTSGGQGGGGGGQGGSGEGCEVTAAPEVTDVAGRWAYLEVGSQLIQAPGFTEPFHNRIVSVLLIDQLQSGENVEFSGEYCDHYTEDPDAIVHAVIPDAYRAALAPVQRGGTFAEVDGSLRYQLPRLHEVVGATLDNPAGDALPEAPDDPRVVDQDGDGNPGMTIHLTGLIDGEVYVVQRKMTALDGVATSPDRIEGLLEFTSEQVVVAADPPSVKDSTDATQSLPDPEPCNSHFRMARVPDDADCAWVKDQIGALFP